MKKHAIARRLDLVLQTSQRPHAPRYRSAPRPWAGRRDAADRFLGAACIPASLSQQVGLALGAQVGESRIHDLVTNAGLSRSAGSARHHSTPCSRPGHSRPSPTSATIRPGPQPPDQLAPKLRPGGGEGLGWRYLPADAARAGIPTVTPTPTSPRELQSGHHMQRSRRMEGHQ
jgi:hypothetical protein